MAWRNRPRVTRDTDDANVTRWVLRAVLSGTMVAHGVRHARTLDGTASWFESIGFRQPRLQARLSAVIEVGSGAAVAAGAFVPLSTAAMVGTMGVAYGSVHRPNGYFIVSEGWEYVGFISAAAVALSALGAGRMSVDRRLGLDRVGGPGARAALTAGVGIAGALVQLRTFWNPPPA